MAETKKVVVEAVVEANITFTCGCGYSTTSPQLACEHVAKTSHTISSIVGTISKKK